MGRQLIFKTSRWSAEADDEGTSLYFKTTKGVFSLGVDNYGNPYVAVMGRLVIRPDASNRAQISEE